MHCSCICEGIHKAEEEKDKKKVTQSLLKKLSSHITIKLFYNTQSLTYIVRVT